MPSPLPRRRATFPPALTRRFPSASFAGRDWLSTRWHVAEGGRHLELRVLRPELASASSRTGNTGRALEAWRANLALRHPAFAAVHDLGATPVGDGIGGWVLLDRIDAPSLRELVAERPLTPPVAASLMLQVVYALEDAAPHGPHLGLTPDTVRIETQPSLAVRLLDHGLLAAFSRDAPTVGLRDGGRSAWFAPEQLSGHASGAQTDMWQVGALLRFAISGCSPAEDIDDGELGTVAAGVIRPLMHPDPFHRPDDFASVAARLEDLAAGGDVDITPRAPTLRIDRGQPAGAPSHAGPPVWLEFAAPVAAAAFGLAAFALFFS